jgi:acetyltransferase
VNFFFTPAGCAVVGASKDPAKPGHQILRSLLDAGFPPGRLFPVNPGENEIAGLPAYPTLASIPAPLDLAVLMVPPRVLETVTADVAARAKTEGDLKGIIVTAGGFAELGTEEGRLRQAKLVEAVRAAGVRLMGPNCVGVIDTFSRLDTTFLHGVVRRQGPITFVSQSGAVGAWLLQMLSSEPEPIGFSKFISLGNMADVTMAETLDYLRGDPTTGVVGLYLEGVPEPRPLLGALAALARDKPVVVLKTGRTESGRAAATSHTGALAGADRVWDGALRQAGVLRVDGMEEFVDTLGVLASRIPPGDTATGRGTPLRVFLVTHAGGPGVYTMDLLAARSTHLTPAVVSPETKAALGAAVPPLSSVCRPEGHIDMTASATPEQHAQVVKLLLADPGVEALVTIDLPIRFLSDEDVALALAGAWKEHLDAGPATDKLFLPLLMHGKWSEAGRGVLARAGLPALAGPDRAVAVLANVARLAGLEAEAPGAEPSQGPVPCSFVPVPCSLGPVPCSPAPSDEVAGPTLNEVESAALLEATGVRFAPSRLVRSKSGAVAAARQLGFPVVIKLCSRYVPHKAAVGAIRLGLRTPEEVARACDELLVSAARLLGDQAGLDGLLVQAQTPSGTEVIVGGLRDPIFGPVVAAGPGGTRVGLDAPLSFRLAPLSEEGAFRLADAVLASLGDRFGDAVGDRPKDRAATDLARSILGMSRLMISRPDVIEADINPIILLAEGLGAIAVDALVRLA